MSEPTNGPGPADGGEPADAEIARLEAERDELRSEVEHLQDRPGHRIRLRRITAAILVVLTVICFALIVPAAWGRRTALNTDRYVATVAPLAEDPAVQQALAARVTQSVFETLNVEPVIAEALPDRASFLARPLTDAMQNFVQEQVEKVFASDAFQTFWVAANRFVHTQVLAILDGNPDTTVSVREGKVFLNLLPLVNLALGEIQAIATDLVGHDVTLPTITADEVPAEAIAALESALGRDLPDDLGQIPVYDANELQAIQDGVRLFERGVLLLALVLLVLLVGAIWISPTKRRTILQLAVAATAVLVIERRLALRLGDRVIAQAGGDEHPAVGVLVNTLLSSLRRYTGWMLLILLVTIAVVLLTGPYPWARSLRAWAAGLGPALTGAVSGSGENPSPAATFIGAHRDALLVAGAAALVLLVMLIDLSFGWLLALVAVVALYELVVYQVARGVRGTADAQPVP
jgi:hypothetical protein